MTNIRIELFLKNKITIAKNPIKDINRKTNATMPSSVGAVHFSLFIINLNKIFTRLSPYLCRIKDFADVGSDFFRCFVCIFICFNLLAHYFHLSKFTKIEITFFLQILYNFGILPLLKSNRNQINVKSRNTKFQREKTMLNFSDMP